MWAFMMGYEGRSLIVVRLAACTRGRRFKWRPGRQGRARSEKPWPGGGVLLSGQARSGEGATLPDRLVTG